MFELHISCTKDIGKLKIDFTDGTSVEGEPVQKQDWPEEKINVPVKKEQKEIVKPPVIPDVERPPKIDNILNNLEI